MKYSLSFLLFFFIVNFALAVKANDEVVMLGTKAQWKPYHINTPDGADGLAVRALSCVMARINQPFLISKKPWKRVQYEVKQGKLDGFFAASRNDKRDGYATLSKVFLPQERSIYLLKKNFGDQPTLDYIKTNFTFAARAGSNALNSLLKKEFQVTVQPKSEEQLLKLLDKNRVEAILENSLVFDTLIAKQGRALNEFHKVVLEEKHMGVYFSHAFLKQRPNFLQKFNANVEPCSLLMKNKD